MGNKDKKEKRKPTEKLEKEILTEKDLDSQNKVESKSKKSRKEKKVKKEKKSKKVKKSKTTKDDLEKEVTKKPNLIEHKVEIEEKVDEKINEKPVEAVSSTLGWNNWNQANLGSSARNEKFLKLMGAKKISNQSDAARNASGTQFDSKSSLDLQNQFDLSLKLNQKRKEGKKLGLGSL